MLWVVRPQLDGVSPAQTRLKAAQLNTRVEVRAVRRRTGPHRSGRVVLARRGWTPGWATTDEALLGAAPGKVHAAVEASAATQGSGRRRCWRQRSGAGAVDLSSAGGAAVDLGGMASRAAAATKSVSVVWSSARTVEWPWWRSSVAAMAGWLHRRGDGGWPKPVRVRVLLAMSA